MTAFMRINSTGLERAGRCPASAYLPKQQTKSVAAAKGQQKHDEIDAAAKLAKVSGAKKWDKNDHLRQFLATMAEDGWQHELPAALNVYTGEARILPKGKHREYKSLNDQEEVGCTFDAVNLGTFPAAVDWKTGKWIGDPASATQMLVQGSVVMKIADAKAVMLVVAYLRGKDKVVPDTGVFRPAMKDAFLDMAKNTFDSVRKSLTVYNETGVAGVSAGSHCNWCNSKAVCPAWGGR
jgi:hypothetical protein